MTLDYPGEKTNISHVGNRNIIFKSALEKGYVSFQEGTNS